MSDSTSEAIHGPSHPQILSLDELPELPGGWMEDRIEFGGRVYDIVRPKDPDLLLDDPRTLAANERDDYMPYWPYIWPAAVAMAEEVARRDWPRGAKTLEIGCGLGIVGLVALDRGLDVTFSDYVPEAVTVAVRNARKNGFPEAEGRVIDWREPVTQQYEIVLGCDLVYEQRSHAPILDFVERILAPGGVFYNGDPLRGIASEFVELARKRGLDVEVISFEEKSHIERVKPLGGKERHFQWIRIIRRG